MRFGDRRTGAVQKLLESAAAQVAEQHPRRLVRKLRMLALHLGENASSYPKEIWQAVVIQVGDAVPQPTCRVSTPKPERSVTSSNTRWPAFRYRAAVSSAKWVFSASSRPSVSKSPMAIPMPACSLPSSFTARPDSSPCSEKVPSPRLWNTRLGVESQAT